MSTRTCVRKNPEAPANPFGPLLRREFKADANSPKLIALTKLDQWICAATPVDVIMRDRFSGVMISLKHRQLFVGPEKLAFGAFDESKEVLAIDLTERLEHSPVRLIEEEVVVILDQLTIAIQRAGHKSPARN